MINKKILFNIYISILSICILTLIILALLGKINRIGYLSDLQLNIDKTLALNNFNVYNTKKLFIIDNKLDTDSLINYLFTNENITNYSYGFRVKYYSKVFRNSDIYGVFIDNNKIIQENNFIKEIKMNDDKGTPFGSLISAKKFTDSEKIDNINYILRLKNQFLLYSLLILFLILFVYFIFLNKEKILNLKKLFLNKKILKLFIYIISSLFILVIFLGIFGIKKRACYISDINLNIEKTLHINAIPFNYRELFFINNKDADENLFTNSIFTNENIKDYVYDFNIGYYDKLFKENYIYKVNIDSNQILKDFDYIKYIKNNSRNEYYGVLVSSKKIDDKIDNINYTLSLKIIFIYIEILLFAIFLLLLSILSKNIKLSLDILYYVLLGILILISSISIFYNISQAAWNYYYMADESGLLGNIAQGIPLKLLPFGDSRFRPLYFIHINFPLIIGSSPKIFSAYFSILFILTIILLYFVFKNYSKNKLLSIVLIFLVLFGIKQFPFFYMYTIFPKTPTIILLLVSVLFYQMAVYKNNYILYLISLILAVLNTYHEELNFAIYFIFSLSMLLFLFKKLDKKHRYFLISLLINSLIYLSIYVLLNIIYPQSENYAEFNSKGSFIYLFQIYLREDNFFLIFLILSFIRAYFILIKKDRDLIMYDSYLFTGIGLSIGYCLLKIYGLYYFSISSILYMIALSGYIGFILKNSNVINRVIFISFFAFSLLISTISYNFNINFYNKILYGRNRTDSHIKTLIKLNNYGFELDHYFEKDKNINNAGWNYFVVDSFLKYYKTNGKYIYDRNILKEIYLDDIKNTDNKNIILVQEQNDGQFVNDSNYEFLFNDNGDIIGENNYIKIYGFKVCFSDVYVQRKYYKEALNYIIDSLGYYYFL